MSTFFPHSQYAEDQPLSKTILTTHVLHRGLQTGAVAGVVVAPLITYRQRRQYAKLMLSSNDTVNTTATTRLASSNVTSTPMSTSTKQAVRQMVQPSVLRTMERSAGVGAVVGVTTMAFMLPLYMRGQTEIQWQDRSWRLLASEGQVEVDSWSLAGTGLGLVSALTKSSNGLDWRTVVGRSAVGNVLGVVGYMGWRYGVHRGKRDEAV